jgi:RNA polymerase sigma factor (sigma-70 family)
VFDASELNEVVTNAEPLNEAEATGNRKRGRQANDELTDAQMVVNYRTAARQHGVRSEAASFAFEPIFRRYWSMVYGLASSRLGAVYAEDLAAEAMSTVLERLNGKEDITNLRGLVRHSFEREYASLLEKLFQGKKLMRAGITGVEEENGPKVKGATVVSLNVPASRSESDDLELLHLLDDPTADVPQAAARREMIQTLHNLIDQMPPQYRGPLVCQWLMGMRIKEVSETLGLTIDQVKHNTARGLKWLQKRLPGNPQDWIIA